MRNAHKEKNSFIGKRGFPTYVLTIKEIYDNSVDAFGKKIYP